jgi:hypothetical protein
MLLTQVFSPFAYAASGDVESIEDVTPVVEETEDEPVVIEPVFPEVQPDIVNETQNPEKSLGDTEQLS